MVGAHEQIKLPDPNAGIGPENRFYSLKEALACPDPGAVRELYLHNQQLSEFPMEILKFTDLSKLELGYNQLSTLPDELARLTGLRELGLSYNRFSVAPNAVFMMQRLSKLSITGNPLTKDTKRILEKELDGKLYPQNSRGKAEW
jgi:Leucine-rich repeat (LRR) protein